MYGIGMLAKRHRFVPIGHWPNNGLIVAVLLALAQDGQVTGQTPIREVHEETG